MVLEHIKLRSFISTHHSSPLLVYLVNLHFAYLDYLKNHTVFENARTLFRHVVEQKKTSKEHPYTPHLYLDIDYINPISLF